MKQAKTLKHKITNHSRIFDETVEIYNQALSFIIDVIDAEFGDISMFSTKDMVMMVEKLIHTTKSNPLPKYKEFNQRFYKFPSYFRRAAIASAVGKVNSFRSNYQNWWEEKQVVEKEGKTFKKNPPRLQSTHKEFPVMYKGNMFNRLSDSEGEIKVFHKNDWVWVNIQFKKQDLEKRNVVDWKECNPKLVAIGKK